LHIDSVARGAFNPKGGSHCPNPTDGRAHPEAAAAVVTVETAIETKEKDEATVTAEEEAPAVATEVPIVVREEAGVATADHRPDQDCSLPF